MKAKDLIKKLQELPEDTDVQVRDIYNARATDSVIRFRKDESGDIILEGGTW